jgi:membrane-bound lytic murein transglycosylase D
MVLAAYNAGPGTISKAIRRSGGKKTYWEIRPFLPIETQGYVPAFIAANYVMNYAAEHNIYPAVPRKTYFEVDTVVVKEQMTFDQIAQTLDVSSEEILYFNPQYRKNVIPAGGNAMCLPKAKIGIFLNNEQDIYNAIKAQQNQTQLVETFTEVKKIHTVKAGEKLSTIARKYGVTITDLRTWNYVGKKGVKSGKRLTVYVKETNSTPNKLEIKPESKIEQSSVSTTTNDSESKLVAEVSATSTAKKDNEFIIHKVKKGDTFFEISKKYGVAPANIRAINNLSSKATLSIGQMLKIKEK